MNPRIWPFLTRSQVEQTCFLCNCEFVTFPLVSWVRCGAWLYRFLIFAPLLTLLEYHCVVTDKIFFMFIYNLYIKHVTIGRGNFWPKGHNLNKLEVHSAMLHTYQMSRLCVLWIQTRFFFVFLYKPMYYIWHPGCDHFWHQCIYWRSTTWYYIPNVFSGKILWKCIFSPLIG